MHIDASLLRKQDSIYKNLNFDRSLPKMTEWWLLSNCDCDTKQLTGPRNLHERCVACRALSLPLKWIRRQLILHSNYHETFRFQARSWKRTPPFSTWNTAASFSSTISLPIEGTWRGGHTSAVASCHQYVVMLPNRGAILLLTIILQQLW